MYMVYIEDQSSSSLHSFFSSPVVLKQSCPLLYASDKRAGESTKVTIWTELIYPKMWQINKQKHWIHEVKFIHTDIWQVFEEEKNQWL